MLECIFHTYEIVLFFSLMLIFLVCKIVIIIILKWHRKFELILVCMFQLTLYMDLFTCFIIIINWYFFIKCTYLHYSLFVIDKSYSDTEEYDIRQHCILVVFVT